MSESRPPHTTGLPSVQPLSAAASSLPSVERRRHTAWDSPVIVPIRSLGMYHRDRIAEHLLALSAHDRYLRFGHVVDDQRIHCYVQGLDFARDEVFGIFNRTLRLVAMAHLAYVRAASTGPWSVEFGVSVAEPARGRGFGSRLFERAVIHARNDGITQMHIHALSENRAMLKIARDAGARVRCDGCESGAYLQLPAPTIDSQLSEIVLEHFAQMDYGLKFHSWPFWQWLQQQQRPKALP